ncbi:MAG: transposase zinc-binding domain-containing protein [Pirellulaceae bacterium]
MPVMAPPCVKPPTLYRPRDPQASDLWRLMDPFFETFQQVYDARFQAKYGYCYWRPVIERSVQAFLKCGDLQEGFARVRCPDCKHMRNWQHRGFRVDPSVFLPAGDQQGIERLVRHRTRCPFRLSNCTALLWRPIVTRSVSEGTRCGNSLAYASG